MFAHVCYRGFILNFLIVVLVGCGPLSGELSEVVPTPTDPNTAMVSVQAVTPISTYQVTETPTSLVAPVSFENLCRMGSHQLISMDTSSVRQWVVNTYSVTPMQPFPAPNDITHLTWASPDISGDAYLRNDALIKLKLTSGDRLFTLQAIVDGLGDPEIVLFYTRILPDGSVDYLIGFDYPSEGIYISTSDVRSEGTMLSPEGKLVLQMRPDMVVYPSIVCTPPYASIEDALRADPELSDAQVDNILRYFTSWPGLGEWLVFPNPQD